jgi:hypothetical protein
VADMTSGLSLLCCQAFALVNSVLLAVWFAPPIFGGVNYVRTYYARLRMTYNLLTYEIIKVNYLIREIIYASNFRQSRWEFREFESEYSVFLQVIPVTNP